jgi:hypothetical protein
LKEAKSQRYRNWVDPKFPQNIRPINLCYTAGKVLEIIQKIVQKHTEERGLLNESQFGFYVRHSTTLQFMRITDHVTLHFNNNMSTCAVFLDNKEAFDITRHYGLLYKLSKLEFSISLMKLDTSFLSQRKFRVSVEGEMSTPRDIRAGVPPGSILSPTLYGIYIKDTPQTHGVSLPMTPVYMRQTAKRVMLSESCSEVSVLLIRGVSAGT